MGLRLSRFAMGLMVVAAIVVLPAIGWAVYFPLGPSEDHWGLKYDVRLSEAEGDKLNVHFTLADEGRLKPIHSAVIVVLSELDSNGSRTYLMKTPIPLKSTANGALEGQLQMPRKYSDIGVIRIFTRMVDGRRQQGGTAYYAIPLKDFVDTEQTDGLKTASE